jgi:hemerythrin
MYLCISGISLSEESRMKWYDKYNIGVAIIDTQHRELFRMIGRLQTSLSSKNVDEEMGNALKFLVDYAKHHFSAEEELMKRIGFPHYDHQKELHKKFIQEIANVLVRVKKGESVTVSELIDFLTDWIINHILDEDKKIGNYIAHKQEKIDQLLGTTSQEKSLDIKTKLNKLKIISNEQLISKKDFEAKKSELLEKYCSADSEISNNAVEDIIHMLKLLRQKDLITTEDEKKFKSIMFKKLNLTETLKKIPEIAGKLKYLKSSLEEQLITADEYESHKSKLLDEFC